MLKQLRLKLSITCTLITSAILLAMAVSALITSENQLNDRSILSLESNLATIANRLTTDKTISQLWLSQMEATNGLIISIHANEEPFLFNGDQGKNPKKSELIETVNELASSTYDFNPSTIFLSQYDYPTLTFSLHYEDTHFLVATAYLPSSQGYYKLTLLKNMANEDAELWRLRFIFLGLTALSTLLLFAFSWWFSGRAIMPIEKSRQEQNDFVAAASHELRTPLAVIESSTSILLEDETIPNKHFVQMIAHECNRLSRLVSDLLLLARVDSGKWSINQKPVEIDTLLLEVYDLFFSHVESHHKTLELALPDEMLPPVTLDPDRIEQVLIILIDNAIAYTPDDTHIKLELIHLGHAVEIHVTDNGPGITAQDKTQVFKRFYRQDASRHDGTHAGLGLSIAYEIIRLHHGTLRLEDAPGGGCLFIITFPLKKS